MPLVLLTFLLPACEETAETGDSGIWAQDFQVQSAGFLGSTWGDGVVGSADLVLTSTPLSCAQLSDAAWGDRYYSELQEGAGVVLRLAYQDKDGGGVDSWAGTYAPSSFVPDSDTAAPQHLVPSRSARALWFEPAAWYEDNGGLVVELQSVGPAGVAVRWRHSWGGGDVVAGACGQLPIWLSDVSAPAACEAYVVSYNQCAMAYGLGAELDAATLGCEWASKPYATYYLCRAEGMASAECSTQEGWDAANLAAGSCQRP
jgi:hypothetical protein